MKENELDKALSIDLQWFGEEDDPNPEPSEDNQDPPPAETPPAGGEPVEAPRWIFQTEKALQGDKRLWKYGSSTAAAKALLDFEDKLSRSVEIPGEDATPEQRSAMWNRLGRPEQAEQYALKTPENFNADGEFLKTVRAKAHEAGFSQAQAQVMLDLVASREAGIKAANEAGRAAAAANGLKELRQLWGVRFDERVDTATRFMQTIGNESALAALAAAGVDNNPAVIAMFARAGEMLGPDHFVEGVVPNESEGPYPYMNKD